jgi:hypothetical protein
MAVKVTDYYEIISDFEHDIVKRKMFCRLSLDRELRHIGVFGWCGSTKKMPCDPETDSFFVIRYEQNR